MRAIVDGLDRTGEFNHIQFKTYDIDRVGADRAREYGLDGWGLVLVNSNDEVLMKLESHQLHTHRLPEMRKKLRNLTRE